MSELNKKSVESGVLYLDADTEITEAIEKLRKSSKKEVRIVVPSRSGLLQSQVNVKLLKKASQDSDKELVIVTNDRITKNLAGGAGIAVATSVKAMPHVPDVEQLKPKPSENIRLDQDSELDKPKDTSKATNKSDSEGFQPKHISLDSSEDEEDVTGEKPRKNKKEKKVPDYGKLNKRIWIIGVAISILVVIILASIFLPTAKVDLISKAKKTSLNFNFILDSAISQSDIT